MTFLCTEWYSLTALAPIAMRGTMTTCRRVQTQAGQKRDKRVWSVQKDDAMRPMLKINEHFSTVLALSHSHLFGRFLIFFALSHHSFSTFLFGRHQSAAELTLLQPFAPHSRAFACSYPHSQAFSLASCTLTQAFSLLHHFLRFLLYSFVSFFMLSPALISFIYLCVHVVAFVTVYAIKWMYNCIWKLVWEMPDI